MLQASDLGDTVGCIRLQQVMICIALIALYANILSSYRVFTRLTVEQ